MIKDIFLYHNFINELIKRDIKKKYRRSILGIIWSMLNPLFMMIITAMVFSHLFRFDIKNFALYLLTGQLIFTFYAEATNFAMSSILENGSLIKKVYIPKYLFPLSRVLSSGVNLCFTIPALFLIMWYTNQEIHFTIFLSIIPLILLLIFCLGIGLILATIAVYFRDVFHLYGVFLSALNYATPIFYPKEIVPASYQFIIKYNPLYYYLEAFRNIVYSNSIPSADIWIICIGLSITSLGLGLYVFLKKQNNFVLYI